MGGIKSREKGKKGEREVIAILQPVVNDIFELFATDAPRLQRNQLQSDGGGSDIAGLAWMALEVKYQEGQSTNSWWHQCLKQAGKDKTPILFFRRNNMPWRVRMLGMLGTPSAGLTVPVTVELDAFLAWFRIKLTQELS